MLRSRSTAVMGSWRSQRSRAFFAIRRFLRSARALTRSNAWLSAATLISSPRSEQMEVLVAELRERTALVARGGGEAAVERHRARGKLTARERVDRLVDPGAAFLELNALAAWEMYDGAAPAAGIVTGIGVVEGSACVIVATH